MLSAARTLSRGLNRQAGQQARHFSGAVGTIQVTTLPNGVRVATRQTHDKHVTLGSWFDAGLRDETTKGNAQLLNKLSYAGTTKRPGDKLISEVESMGGSLEVSTGREMSSVVLTCAEGAAGVKQGLDIVSDVSFQSGTDAKAFEEVKKQAESEVDGGSHSTQDLLTDRLHMSVYRDSGLGNSAFCDDFRAVTPQSVKQFRDANYVGSRTVIAAAGGIGSHEQFVKEVTAAGLGDGNGLVKAGQRPPVDEKPYFLGSLLNYRNDEMGPTAYWMLGWETVGWRSPDAVTFMLIEAIIGEYRAFNPNSVLPGALSANRMVNGIANKSNRGCADYVEARQHFYRDTGMLSVFGVTDELALNHARQEVMFQVNSLSTCVTDEEVERAKRELKMKLFSQADGTADKAHSLASDILHLGRYVCPEELVLRLDAIDAAEVQRVAYETLHDSEIACTALGPTTGLWDMVTLRHLNSMKRY